MAMPTKEEMKARFWELENAMVAARAKIAPLREARDAEVNAAAARDIEMMAEIRAIEAEVLPGVSAFDAQQEQAFLARGLGNQVGEDPALAPSEPDADIDQDEVAEA